MRSQKSRSEFEREVGPLLDGLYAAALRLTRHERDAEDLVQDAVLRAYRFFGRFERGTNFRAWLFKILTNTFINKYRRSVKERSLGEESERQSVEARFFSSDATDQAHDPESHLIDRASSEDVLEAIDQLPIDFRMVVVLADLQEFSYKEVAELLEIPVGTVMSRLFRGRKHLQRLLLAKESEGSGQLTDLNEFRSRKKLV